MDPTTGKHDSQEGTIVNPGRGDEKDTSVGDESDDAASDERQGKRAEKRAAAEFIQQQLRRCKPTGRRRSASPPA